MLFNEDFLDAVALVSFIVGVANYRENLTQSDKTEIMNKLDQQTKDILMKLQSAVEEQNKLLREILERLNDAK